MDRYNVFAGTVQSVDAAAARAEVNLSDLRRSGREARRQAILRLEAYQSELAAGIKQARRLSKDQFRLGLVPSAKDRTMLETALHKWPLAAASLRSRLNRVRTMSGAESAPMRAALTEEERRERRKIQKRHERDAECADDLDLGDRVVTGCRVMKRRPQVAVANAIEVARFNELSKRRREAQAAQEEAEERAHQERVRQLELRMKAREEEEAAERAFRESARQLELRLKARE
jgi:hypothetical protein